MYAVFFTPNAEKQLKSLDKETQRRIGLVLERVRDHPERYVKKLAGDPAYKLRVGDYRVIMDIEWNRLVILVIKIGHRKNVYKNIRL